MLSVRQLELSLEVALEEAAEMPETVDVLRLWQQFEKDLAGLDQRDRLRVAGDVLMQLAGLCEAKSEVLWEDWQDAHNTDGPVMGDGWLGDLTRQTQELDFSGLVQRLYHTSSEVSNENKHDEDSVAGNVDKLSILDMLDALDDGDLKSQALAVSHAENVSDWVRALSTVQQGTPQRLVDLQATLKMPLVTVWLAALLGGFCVEQRGDFYATDEIWISDRECQSDLAV